MIKLTVTAIDHSVTLQDPRPVTQNNEEQAVISVEAGISKGINMQWGQFERLAKQLTDLASLGMCTFIVESADGPGYAAQADAPSNPMLDLVTGTITAAAGITGGILTGVNLMSGQIQASLEINGDAGTGLITVTSLTPGFPGNLIDVEIVDSGSGGLAVTSATVSGRTVITVDLGGSSSETVTTVAAEISSVMAGVVAAVASGTGSDAIAVPQDKAALTGGIGSGMTLTVGGAAATVTAIDLTTPTAETITFDVGAVGVAGDVATILLRSNEKMTIASAVLG